VKQNNQRLELNKRFPSMPLKQKTAKAQQENPEAQLQHGDCASSTRNKKFHPREPKKITACHLHRSNKKLRKPNRKPRKPKPNKKLVTPDAKQNYQPRELNKAFPFVPRLNKKLRKPNSRIPRKRNSDTKM
jgi:hypothetical protein